MRVGDAGSTRSVRKSCAPGPIFSATRRSIALVSTSRYAARPWTSGGPDCGPPGRAPKLPTRPAGAGAVAGHEHPQHLAQQGTDLRPRSRTPSADQEVLQFPVLDRPNRVGSAEVRRAVQFFHRPRRVQPAHHAVGRIDRASSAATSDGSRKLRSTAAQIVADPVLVAGDDGGVRNRSPSGRRNKAVTETSRPERRRWRLPMRRAPAGPRIRLRHESQRDENGGGEQRAGPVASPRFAAERRRWPLRSASGLSIIVIAYGWIGIAGGEMRIGENRMNGDPYL